LYCICCFDNSRSLVFFLNLCSRLVMSFYLCRSSTIYCWYYYYFFARSFVYLILNFPFHGLRKTIVLFSYGKKKMFSINAFFVAFNCHFPSQYSYYIMMLCKDSCWEKLFSAICSNTTRFFWLKFLDRTWKKLNWTIQLIKYQASLFIKECATPLPEQHLNCF
jgi:hypothetical protein